MPNCSVFSCKKRSETSSLQKDNTTFHLFPKIETIRAAWIEASGNHVTWRPKRRSSMCSQHFESSCFVLHANNKRRLLKTAIPTLKLPKHPRTDYGQGTSSVEMTDGLQLQQKGAGNTIQFQLHAPECYVPTSTNISLPKVEDASGNINLARHMQNTPPLFNQDPEQMLPEVRALIARVHRYLQHEYHQLKTFVGNSVDLTMLANIDERTAAATGVSETAVAAILNADKQPHETTDVGEERPRADGSEEDDDGTPTQQQHEDHEMVTLKVEIEENEYEPYSGFQSSSPVHERDSDHHSIPPRLSREAKSDDHFTHPLTEVKIEPTDGDIMQSSSAADPIMPNSSHLMVKSEPPDERSVTSQEQLEVDRPRGLMN